MIGIDQEAMKENCESLEIVEVEEQSTLKSPGVEEDAGDKGDDDKEDKPSQAAEEKISETLNAIHNIIHKGNQEDDTKSDEGRYEDGSKGSVIYDEFLNECEAYSNFKKSLLSCQCSNEYESDGDGDGDSTCNGSYHPSPEPVAEENCDDSSSSWEWEEGEDAESLRADNAVYFQVYGVKDYDRFDDSKILSESEEDEEAQKASDGYSSSEEEEQQSDAALDYESTTYSDLKGFNDNSWDEYSEAADSDYNPEVFDSESHQISTEDEEQIDEDGVDSCVYSVLNTSVKRSWAEINDSEDESDELFHVAPKKQRVIGDPNTGNLKRTLVTGTIGAAIGATVTFFGLVFAGSE